MNRYADIIHLPHHVSPKRARMSDYDRAAQFSPFAALVGYEDAIDEAARLTDQKITLTDSAREEIDISLRQIAAAPSQLQVACTWFCPDEYKDGGAYQSIVGTAQAVDLYHRRLVLEGREILFEDIVALRILGKREKN